MLSKFRSNAQTSSSNFKANSKTAQSLNYINNLYVSWKTAANLYLLGCLILFQIELRSSVANLNTKIIYSDWLHNIK